MMPYEKVTFEHIVMFLCDWKKQSELADQSFFKSFRCFDFQRDFKSGSVTYRYSSVTRNIYFQQTKGNITEVIEVRLFKLCNCLKLCFGSNLFYIMNANYFLS